MRVRLFLFGWKYADFDAPVERLVVRIACIGGHIPAFTLNAELVWIKFKLFNQRAADRIRPSRTQLPHSLDRDAPFHA